MNIIISIISVFGYNNIHCKVKEGGQLLIGYRPTNHSRL